MRAKFLSGITGLCLLATPAVALTPPPVTVPIVVISQDTEAQAVGEAFVTMLHEHGWFGRGTAIQRTGLGECVRQTEKREACLRSEMDWNSKGAAVVVLVSGTNKQDWQCIGIGETAKDVARQSVSIDIQSGMFGSAEARLDARRKAAGCIMSAGSESGW